MHLKDHGNENLKPRRNVMRKMIVGAFLLSLLLLIGIVPLSGCGDRTPMVTDSQIGEAEVLSAAAAFPEIRIKKAHYDSVGNLTGCYGNGSDCVLVVFTDGTEGTYILVPTKDVQLK